MSAILFEEARNKIIGKNRDRIGIGTLQEKTVHAVLKHYYAPDEEEHEIPIQGYVADIYRDGQIIEIQNGNFYKMRSKLETFLRDYEVTVVYPIPHIKWLIWIDEESGELSPRRKSPVTGNAYKAFAELYRIKNYLKHENLHFRFPLVDMEEYRLLNGWSKDRKKGSCRYDRIPVALFDEVVIERREDYLQFLPIELPEEFTSKDLAKVAKIPAKVAGQTLHILTYLQVTQQIGKRERLFVYRIAEEFM